MIKQNSLLWEWVPGFSLVEKELKIKKDDDYSEPCCVEFKLVWYMVSNKYTDSYGNRHRCMYIYIYFLLCPLKGHRCHYTPEIITTLMPRF